MTALLVTLLIAFIIAVLICTPIAVFLAIARAWKRDIHAIRAWPLTAEHMPDIPADGRVHYWWYAIVPRDQPKDQ